MNHIIYVRCENSGACCHGYMPCNIIKQGIVIPVCWPVAKVTSKPVEERECKEIVKCDQLHVAWKLDS